jgi:ankyrin repeat protein
LAVSELRHALAVEPQGTCLDSDNLLETEDIVSVCEGLVTIDRKSNVIRLVHYTAHEYFERTRSTWSPHGHLDITRTCLTYLAFDTFRNGSCSNLTGYKHRLNAYPFLEYAARYWGKHALFVQDVIFDLAYATLLDQSVLSSMSQVLDVSKSLRWNASQRYPTTRNILHMLAYFGLNILAEKLLAQHEDSAHHWINQNENKQGTCLYVAAEQGQDAVVKLLLDQGAEVNGENGRLGSVLKVAVYEEHSSTVKLLLDNGADINMNDKHGGAVSTALHLASDGDKIEMARLLLSNEADVTIKNTYGQTPLQLATERGSYEVIKLLLDWMPERSLESDDEPGYTPLVWACASGQIAAVKHFWKDEADQNTLFREGLTPPHAASNWGDLDVVRLLLDHGADPTIRNCHGETPLECAIAENHFSVVPLLLSREVNLDIRGALARATMDKASWNGSVTTVKELLEKGVGVDVTNEDGWTPINNAASRGHLEVVELLLEHGADFNLPNERGHTPLFNVTTFCGRLEVIKLLLGKGAVISTLQRNTDEHKRNLLHLSAQRGQLDTFLYIADQGVDALAKDAKEDGLLAYAATSGSFQVLESALSIAPASAVQDDEHWSPLHWACRSGDAQIVKRLLQSKLRAHCVTLPPSNNVWSPADIAIHHGHKSMLEDLPDPCKIALGPVTTPERDPGVYRSASCDACFQVSNLREFLLRLTLCRTSLVLYLHVAYVQTLTIALCACRSWATSTKVMDGTNCDSLPVWHLYTMARNDDES